MPGTGLGMHKGNGGEVLGMGKLGGMLAGGYMHMGVGRECELAGGAPIRAHVDGKGGIGSA